MNKFIALWRAIFVESRFSGLAFTVLLSVLVLVAAIIGWVTLPRPDVILSISARSQTFAYQVTDKRAASLELENVQIVQNRLDNLDAPRLVCLSGRLVPGKDALIRYRLLNTHAVSIAFAGFAPERQVAVLEKEGGGIVAIKALDTLLLDTSNQACPARLPAAIPVWGPGNIGTLRTFGTGLGHEPGDLVGGQVRITARAVEHFFFFIKGAQGLYDAGIVAIPAGAMLRSVVPPGRRKNALPQTDWIGAARPINADGFAGFQVDISTESDTVLLYRAGLGKADRPDIIGASAFVSQTRDPGVLGLQIGLALMLIIIQTVAAVIQTISTGPEKPAATGQGQKPS